MFLMSTIHGYWGKSLDVTLMTWEWYRMCFLCPVAFKGNCRPQSLPLPFLHVYGQRLRRELNWVVNRFLIMKRSRGKPARGPVVTHWSTWLTELIRLCCTLACQLGPPHLPQLHQTAGNAQGLNIRGQKKSSLIKPKHINTAFFNNNKHTNGHSHLADVEKQKWWAKGTRWRRSY